MGVTKEQGKRATRPRPSEEEQAARMRHTPLTSYEKETIILFNEGEPNASIFTYNTTWQRRLESLGFKPIAFEEGGAREYEVPKRRIRPPAVKRTLSEEARAKSVARLAKFRKGKKPSEGGAKTGAKITSKSASSAAQNHPRSRGGSPVPPGSRKGAQG